MYIRSVAMYKCSQEFHFYGTATHFAINNVSIKCCHGNETMILVCYRETYGTINSTQDRLYTYNVTLWRVRVMFIPPRLS
jgi:hypothetical protein